MVLLKGSQFKPITFLFIGQLLYNSTYLRVVLSMQSKLWPIRMLRSIHEISTKSQFPIAIIQNRLHNLLKSYQWRQKTDWRHLTTRPAAHRDRALIVAAENAATIYSPSRFPVCVCCAPFHRNLDLIATIYFRPTTGAHTHTHTIQPRPKRLSFRRNEANFRINYQFLSMRARLTNLWFVAKIDFRCAMCTSILLFHYLWILNGFLSNISTNNFNSIFFGPPTLFTLATQFSNINTNPLVQLNWMDFSWSFFASYEWTFYWCPNETNKSL